MAYRDFDLDTMTDIVADTRRAEQAVRSAPSPDFGALEAAAVWLGHRDEPASLDKSGVSRWLRYALRLEPERRLANPRLEGLRRLTVVLRHGLSGRFEEEKASAREAGVSETQIAALEARFAV